MFWLGPWLDPAPTSRPLRRGPCALRLFLSALAALAVAWLPAAGRAQDPVPEGPEFQVNTFTTSYQQSPTVAVAPSGAATGRFLVLWESEASPDDASSLDRKSVV